MAKTNGAERDQKMVVGEKCFWFPVVPRRRVILYAHGNLWRELYRKTAVYELPLLCCGTANRHGQERKCFMNPIVLVWERGVIHNPHNIRTAGTPCITNLIDGAGGMIRKTDSANLCAELPHTAPHGAICLWKPMARIAFKKNPSLQHTTHLSAGLT